MKAKKLLTTSLLFGVMVLAACGPKHTHVADGIWQNDETNHWQLCKDGDGFKMNVEAHDLGNPVYSWDSNNKCKAVKDCSVCDYEITVQEVQGQYVMDTAATCTTNEKGHFVANFTAEGLVNQATALNSYEKQGSALDHNFGGVVTYSWNEDECTASRDCQREGCTAKETETVTGTYAMDTAATCLENEKGHYEAEFENEAFEDQETPENSVEVPGTSLGHAFGGTVTYTWNDDECTASHKCQHEPCTQTEEETVTGEYVKDTDASCTENEKGHYKATFTIKGFEEQNTEANSVTISGTATGHAFGGEVTYVWNGDECTASHKCQHEPCTQTEEETVTGEYVKDTDASCTENEKGHYKATFLNVAFGVKETEKDSVEMPGTSLGHSYGDIVYVWDGAECTAKKECTKGDDTVVIQTVTGVYAKDTDAKCGVNEKGHYEATFTEEGTTNQKTEANSVDNPDTALKHDFESGSNVCKKCGSTNLLKFTATDFIREPSKLTETTDVAPEGFDLVYSYTGTCGSALDKSTGNTFFKQDFEAGEYTHLRFAILHTADNPISFVCGTGSWPRYSLEKVTEDTWVTIEAVRDSSKNWTVTNSLGKFTSHTGDVCDSYVGTGSNIYKFIIIVASNAIKLTELLVDSSTTVHNHEFGEDGVCTGCGYKMLDYTGESSKLRDKTKISVTNMNAPDGFEKFYYYSEAVNASAAASFFIDGNATGLASATEFRYAILQRSGVETMLQVPTGNYYNYRFVANNYGLWGWSQKSNIIYVYGQKTGDGEWTITNSVEKFRQNGTTTDSTSLVIQVAYPNYWNYVLRLIWSNAYITEILYK